MPRQTWFVKYGEHRLGDTGGYVVTDNLGTRLSFRSKREAIAEAQLRNGWQVDGSERNYASQVSAATRRP